MKIKEKSKKWFQKRFSSGKSQKYYERSGFGDVGIFRTTWRGIKNHKKKIIGIPLTIICSYLGIEHNFLSFLQPQTGANMEFLANLDWGWIIAAITTIIVIIQQFLKNGIIKTLASASENIDRALVELERARLKDSPGGEQITKKELVDIVRSAFIHADEAKKKLKN